MDIIDDISENRDGRKSAEEEVSGYRLELGFWGRNFTKRKKIQGYCQNDQ